MQVIYYWYVKTIGPMYKESRHYVLILMNNINDTP